MYVHWRLWSFFKAAANNIFATVCVIFSLRMSENSEKKSPTQFPKANQHSKIFSLLWHETRESSKSNNWEAGIVQCLVFLLEETFKWFGELITIYASIYTVYEQSTNLYSFKMWMFMFFNERKFRTSLIFLQRFCNPGCFRLLLPINMCTAMWNSPDIRLQQTHE